MSTKQKKRSAALARKVAKQKMRQKKLKKQKSKRQISEQPPIEAMVDFALEQIENGKSREGKDLLDQLYAKAHNIAEVNFGLGAYHALKEEYDDALTFFKKATQIKPDFHEAHFNLANIYKIRLDIGNMIISLRDAVKSGEPGIPTYHDAKRFLKEFETQIRKNQGIDLDLYLTAYYHFNRGVEDMGVANWEASIESFQKALEIDSSMPQTFGNLGICYLKLNQKDLAIEYFDNALKIDPNYEPAILNRSMALKMDGGKTVDRIGVPSIEYYKDFKTKKKSLIKEIKNNLGRFLPQN